MHGVEWARVLGAPELTAQLFRAGWSGADLREFVETHKREHMDTLERFAAGALSELDGTPLHAAMVELTAIRYALEQTKPGEVGNYEREEVA